MSEYLVDYHVHSCCSPDSVVTPEEHCEAALAHGLAEIAFTEHFDFEPAPHSFGFRDYAKTRERILAVREAYNGRLKVRFGAEVSYYSRRGTEIEEQFANTQFDFVIGSIHHANGAGISGPDADEYFARTKYPDAYLSYFAELLAMVRTGLFDVVGHFDVVKRYGAKFFGRFELSHFEDIITDIFREMVANGTGLEINTSGLRQEPEECYPALEILRLYRSLGGSILTVGSDSHRLHQLGGGISQAIELARVAGFHRITTFDKRQAAFFDVSAEAQRTQREFY